MELHTLTLGYKSAISTSFIRFKLRRATRILLWVVEPKVKVVFFEMLYVSFKKRGEQTGAT